MRIVSAAALAFLLAISLLGADFIRRSYAIMPGKGEAIDAVVLTGQFDRVHAGLALLREGRAARLLISGVNPGAGILPERFADQFRLDASLRLALASGRLTLATAAQNTLENAAETACWSNAHKLTGPILLITSASHMPRASLALERALPARPVWRMTVPAAKPEAKTLAIEFLKFTVTMMSGLLSGHIPMACSTANTVGRGKFGTNGRGETRS